MPEQFLFTKEKGSLFNVKIWIKILVKKSTLCYGNENRNRKRKEENIMLKDFTIANLLDLNETIAKDLFEGKTYPWEVLPEIGDFIMKLGQTLREEEYDHPSEDVWIAKSAKVAPTACINGPVIIGKEAEVRHCAFIRGKAIVGEGAVVGNSTELKLSLIHI